MASQQPGDAGEGTSGISRPITKKVYRNVEEIMREICLDSESELSSDDDDDAEVSDQLGDDVTENSDEGVTENSDEDATDTVQRKKRKTEVQVGPKFTWSKDALHPEAFDFSGTSGINADLLSSLPYEPTPYDFLLFFICDEIIDILVREANRYAEQFLSSTALTPESRLSRWRDVTPAEMKLFLGMTMLMGVVKKSNLEQYWTNADLFATPAFSSLMPRNRYCMILKFLHFSNNDNSLNKDDQNYDRLFKVREVYNLITGSFTNAYTPGRCVAIDEGMVRWFGRGFRTYLPSKRAKYGMKAYKLCEDNGYTYKFRLYTGKAADDEPNNLPDLVMILMSSLLDEGRVLYMDNYYNSPDLAKMLYERKTHSVGTLRMTCKGVPDELKKLKLKRGEVAFRTCDPITILVWHDKRDVKMITTLHDASVVDVPGKVNRMTGEQVRKPTAIIDYNKHTGSVDKSDQMVLLNSSVRKTLKWSKKLFFLLMNLASTNAFVLFCLHVRKISHLNFIKTVIEQMVRTSVEEEDLRRPAR